MDRISNIDSSFSNAKLWRQEADKLRAILMESGMTEELKWGKPCYSIDGKNICIMQRMKHFLALLFFKGALLKDPDDILEVQGPNSRAGYRMRCTSVQDVARMAKSVKAYVHETNRSRRSGPEGRKSEGPRIP